MKKFSLLLFLTLASTGWAGHIPRTIGGAEILYPVPEGFVEGCAHDKDLTEAFTIGVPASNRLVGGLITEKDWTGWINYTAEENMSPYFILQYSAESENGISLGRWKKFKSNVRNVFNNMWKEFADNYLDSKIMDDAEDTLSRLAKIPVDFEINTMTSLGVYKETDTVLSSLWFVAGKTVTEGVEYQNVQYQTSTMVFLKDRVIIMFAYITKKEESDAETLMEMTDQWVEELVRINGNDYDGSSKDVSDTALKMLDPQEKQ